MNKQGQIDFDMSTVAALGMGVMGGFLALFVIKSTAYGAIFKVVVFLATTLVSAFLAYMIFNKE